MQPKDLKLSLVIPAYNEEDQLYDCLLAVARQDEPIDEVIVVDNNSSDTTAAIARHFPFVTLMHEPRQGLRYSRNTGLDAASGDILGRIDADTQLAPDWARRARLAFMNDQKLAALTGASAYHDMPLPSVSLWGDRNIRKILFYLNRAPLLYGSNMVLRRETWRAVRPHLCKNGEFFEDSDMTIHLADLGLKLAYDPSLVANVSARRMDDPWPRYRANMRQFDATFASHQQKSPAATGAKYVYLWLFLMFKPIRFVFDTDTRQFRLARTNRLTVKARPTSNT
jgi:glycosyltransferase involved in cell wall biosynthesis